MSGQIAPIRMCCPPSAVDVRWLPYRARQPANDDWNPADWHILIVSARDPSLLLHPIKISIARDCRRGLARMQHRHRPPLAVLTRFRVAEREIARAMVREFRRGMRDDALGGDWFAISARDAVERMGSILVEMVRTRLSSFSAGDQEILLDYCGLNDASRFLEAEELATRAAQAVKRAGLRKRIKIVPRAEGSV